MKRMLWWGAALVVVGLWIWLSALGLPGMAFSRDWPVLIIALGVYIIVRRVRRWQRRRRSAAQVITDLEAGRIDAEKALSEIRRSR
jgi:Na+/proline symporter